MNTIDLTYQNQSCKSINATTIIINNSGDTRTLTISETFTINKNDIYFVIGGDNIIVDGQDMIIIVDNVTDFPGLVQNGTDSSKGYNNITIKNININGTSSTLTDCGGWICQMYFGAGTADFSCTNNIINDCCSTGMIRRRAGGILGGNAGCNKGNITIMNCIIKECGEMIRTMVLGNAT